jgi:hypothetical protein
VRGWIVGNRLRLRVRQGAMARNPFQTILSARLDAVPGGTRLRCRLDIGTIAAVLMGLWLAIVLLVGGFLFAAGIGAVADNRAGAQAVGFVVVPPAMLLSGIALVAFGRWCARDEPRVLIAFLEQTVAAREAIAAQISAQPQR